MTGEPWDDWGTSRDPGLTKGGLADRVEGETVAFVEAWHSLPEASRARPRMIGIWSAHDCLAHCVIWGEYARDVLRSSLDGTFRPEDFVFGDEDEFNERTAAELSPIDAGALLARLSEASSAVAGALRRLPEDEWSSRDRFEVVVRATIVDHLPEHARDLARVRAES